MTEYYNINNNNDNEMDTLDKMAREINNKKTSLCREVVNDFNKKEEELKSGINNIINSQKFSYLPMNKNFNNGLYDENTDYSVSDMSYQTSDFESKDNKYFSDINSNDSVFDDKSIDSYLDNKNVKFNKIVKSIEYDDCSKDDDNLLEHIKKCTMCKNKLVKYLNNHHASNTKKNSYKKFYNKEILVFVMIGVFIIIILDILLRYKN